MAARWGGIGEWAEKVRGLRSTNWLLQNGHGDVKYSTGNIARWVRFIGMTAY